MGAWFSRCVYEPSPGHGTKFNHYQTLNTTASRGLHYCYCCYSLFFTNLFARRMKFLATEPNAVLLRQPHNFTLIFVIVFNLIFVQKSWHKNACALADTFIIIIRYKNTVTRSILTITIQL